MFENTRVTNRKESGRIRRGDICLLAFFLFLALGCLVWAVVSRKDGQVLRISCGGEVIEKVDLTQMKRYDQTGAVRGSASETVRYCLLLYGNGRASCGWYGERPDLAAAVPEGNSFNLLAVSADGVSMDAADCRDQICVHHIPIVSGGESIICLPHRLVVEIVGGTGKETRDVTTKAQGIKGETGWNNDRFRNGGSYETDG